MNRVRFLRLFLRMVGSVAGLAAFCAVMPYSWMTEAEAEARTAGRGLWADKAPVPPWEWRNARRE